jgi:hypothetical protein
MRLERGGKHDGRGERVGQPDQGARFAPTNLENPPRKIRSAQLRGRRPKDPAKLSRPRDAKRQEPWLELGEAKTGVPRLIGRNRLTAATRRWWDAWAKSAQAAQFTATDWDRLLKIALVVDDFFRSNDAKERSELLVKIDRLEGKFGATPEDRLRLRWRFRDAEREDEAAAKPKPARKSSRRRQDPRLKLVDGGGGG